MQEERESKGIEKEGNTAAHLHRSGGKRSGMREPGRERHEQEKE